MPQHVSRREFFKGSAAGVSMLAVGLCLAPRQTPGANASTERIDQLRQAFNAAYSAGNAAGIGILLAEDAVWMPPGEPAVVGRSAIQARYAAQFSATHSAFTLNRGEILVLANMAWLRGPFQRIDTPVTGGPSTTTTGKYVMIFRRERSDWKIVNDCWNSDETPQQVDARVALHSVRVIPEWRLGDVGRALSVVVDTDEVKSSIWENMVGLLGRLAAADPQANAIWFVRPDGFYYSVELGFTNLSLAERSYFPGLMAGQSVLGALVISLSTGKRSVIIAEPVSVAGQVIGGVGVSYSVDQLSLEIDEAMQLPPAAVFYALDMSGRVALNRNPALMFEYPSDMSSETLLSAVDKMLAEPSGKVEYIFQDVPRTVFFEKSSVLDWVFALGFKGPAAANLQ
jgi:ketosteroid isomerase-like protein